MSETANNFSTMNLLLAIAGMWLVFNFWSVWAWAGTLGLWSGLAKVLLVALAIIGGLNIIILVVILLAALFGLAIFVASKLG